jgi:stringent starvation protein B
MPTQPLPPKKEVALALLERTSVFVHLDPRVAAVVVPAGFKKQAQLVLQVGLNMPVPIRDLHLDDEGMTCTLSFNRTPFFCVVPWSSVYAVVGCDDGRGMIWPEDVPPEVAQAQARAVESVARSDRPDRREPPKAVPALERLERNGPAGSAASVASVASVPDAQKGAKRPRKRPAAPAMRAVPDADPSSEALPSKPQRTGHSPPSPLADRQPAVSAPPVRRAAEATGRRKRELPPYLRVVK